VQLEHGADLDAGFGQARALGLHVVDVNRRDRALVSRLPGAFPESDLGRAAVETRPALLLVDERLGERELVAIERSRGVEVRDAVPNPYGRFS